MSMMDYWQKVAEGKARYDFEQGKFKNGYCKDTQFDMWTFYNDEKQKIEQGTNKDILEPGLRLIKK